MCGHVCYAPQIYKARWGRDPAAAEFMVADIAEQKKHHFRNAPMLRELKHPNVIEFFDIGEIATGEVRTLLLISRVHGPGHLHHSSRCSFAPFRLGPLKDNQQWLSRKFPEWSLRVHDESAQVNTK